MRVEENEEDAVANPRIACDSFVALAEKTMSGHTVFAKNSDRPAGECQPLKQIAAADWPSAGRLSCQYIEVDQVPHTYAVLGAGPYWLWGLEHGLNECGVVAGNHTIFTKDPVADAGLQGMDLVRLALERAPSALKAVNVATSLIEKHGQGGSGYLDTHWPYNNSFLIADADRAFLLEASARHWALREIDGAGSASNHAVIGADWCRLSADCGEHAREQGWWDGRGRLDFAAAYRDVSVVPPVISSARFARTCEVGKGSVDLPAVKRLMRDHYDSGSVYRPGRSPDDERYYGVCMHADPVGTTTASMVAELRRGQAVPLYWAALANPCIGPFFPLFPQGQLPEELLQGGGSSDSGGAWWRFKDLLTAVEQAPERWAAEVRKFWDAWEQGQAERAEALRGQLEAELAAATAAESVQRHSGVVGDDAVAAKIYEATSVFMGDMWTEASSALEDIHGRIGRV